METERSLLDNAALAVLEELASERSLQSFTHSKEEAEQTASDSLGLQGGQRWSPPTLSPTFHPTEVPSESPSEAPTFHPTPHGEPFVLKGTIWYDRNANSARDSGISSAGFGTDVEWGVGLGAVKVSLVECDVETNREIESNTPSFTTMSQGYNSKMEPMLSIGGGVYKLVNIKIDKSYAVEVEAPSGYLFTSGICNDDERGWKCEYTRSGGGRNLEGQDNGWSFSKLMDYQQEDRSSYVQSFSKLIEGYEDVEEGGLGVVQGYAKGWLSNLKTWASNAASNKQERSLATTSSHNKNNKKNKELSLGITTGRSAQCVTVSREGIPSTTLDFGVMKIGDSKAAEADVALVLDFDDAVVSSPGRRSLKEMMEDATALPQEEHELEAGVRRYLLADRDKTAIGSVTAEVLASQLDKRLAENQIVLDDVVPQDVILSADSEASKKELAVALNIQGHYSPPPELDFEYIVNDSINSDTDQIRRNLKEYNQNCRDQTAKVQSGAGMADFNEVHSMQGARPNRGSGLGGDVYRTVCAEGETLPAMFETSLKEIQATKVSEIAFAPVIYMENEARLESWAMGPVAAVCGLIALLIGVFVFRRALGPRRSGKYRELMKTGNIDGGDGRRFGEMGGDMDDGSVDSAFYSDSDREDFKDDGKDKEKRMRRKLRAEAEKAKSAGKSSKKFGKSAKKIGKSAKKMSSDASIKLAVKSGSADDTDSVPSNESPMDDSTEKKRCKKKSKESSSGSSVRKSARSSAASVKSEKSSKKSSKRGRDKRDGGDNARIVGSELS